MKLQEIGFSENRRIRHGDGATFGCVWFLVSCLLNQQILQPCQYSCRPTCIITLMKMNEVAVFMAYAIINLEQVALTANLLRKQYQSLWARCVDTILHSSCWVLAKRVLMTLSSRSYCCGQRIFFDTVLSCPSSGHKRISPAPILQSTVLISLVFLSIPLSLQTWGFSPAPRWANVILRFMGIVYFKVREGTEDCSAVEALAWLPSAASHIFTDLNKDTRWVIVSARHFDRDGEFSAFLNPTSLPHAVCVCILDM